MNENEYKIQLLQDTITSDAQTIERLADALEECVFIMEKAGLEPESYGDLITKAARALLAEIRGKHA